MSISIDSQGGYISISDFSISWGNAEDPFFADERLEGYFAINTGATSLEFGAIDHERPGIYITRYRDGEVESTTPIVQL